MKKIFLLVLLVISFSVMAISQTITFDKTIPAGKSVQVLQTDDGGYLLYCPDRFTIIKTNPSGYIEEFKEYPEIIQPRKNISKTIDGGYIAIGNKINGLYNDICLVKLDNQLDTTWTRTYGDVNKLETAFSVIQLPDSSYIIASFETGKFFLRKTDALGLMIWSKEIPGMAWYFPTYLVNLNDGNFLFGKLDALIKMNANADTLWIRPVNNALGSSYLTSDGYILFATRLYLQKLDLNGNLIWQISISDVKSFSQSSNGNYLFLKGSSNLLEIDTSGNILSQVSFENSSESIIRTADGGFAVCGMVNSHTWLLKTDSNLNYKAVNMRTSIWMAKI